MRDLIWSKSMGREATAYGGLSQPLSVASFGHSFRMQKPSRLLLKENVERLLINAYGTINKTRFSNDSKISVGTVLRVLAGETSVGLDVVDAIAKHFGVPAYDLLVPGLDPRSPQIVIKKTEIDAARIAREALKRIADDSNGAN